MIDQANANAASGREAQARPMADADRIGLAQELAALQTADRDELGARFRRLYRHPPPESLSRDLIARLAAHRLQERRIGGLDRDLATQLGRLARGQAPRRRLKTGTVLVREHAGQTHEVVIVPGGYLWNGQTFDSLSIIAKRITGTSWNGPRFFGLRPARRKGAEPEQPKVVATQRAASHA